MPKTKRINLTIDPKLDREFRDVVSERLGFKKGNLQVAIEEALHDWIEKKPSKDKA